MTYHNFDGVTGVAGSFSMLPHPCLRYFLNFLKKIKKGWIPPSPPAGKCTSPSRPSPPPSSPPGPGTWPQQKLPMPLRQYVSYLFLSSLLITLKFELLKYHNLAVFQLFLCAVASMSCELVVRPHPATSTIVGIVAFRVRDLHGRRRHARTMVR